MATTKPIGAKGTKDMTEGGIYSNMIYFALPIMLVSSGENISGKSVKISIFIITNFLEFIFV